jgi:hypothetical protein
MNDATARHNSVPKPKITVFLERQPQDAISPNGALWGVLPENARLSRFFPLRAISPYGALCQFPESY